MPPYKRLSPLLEICCLLLSANESYQDAEADIETLTGVKVGHSTQHRQVQTHEWSLPQAKQAINEVSIDGGKVRLRGENGQESYWRDYKAVRLQNIYSDSHPSEVQIDPSPSPSPTRGGEQESGSPFPRREEG